MLNSFKGSILVRAFSYLTAFAVSVFLLLGLAACASGNGSNTTAFDNRVAATVKTPEATIYEGDISNYIQDLRKQNLAENDTTWATVLRAANSNPADIRTQVINQRIDKLLIQAAADELGFTPDEELVRNEIEDTKYDFVGYNGDGSWANSNNESTFTDALHYYGLESEEELFADLAYKHIVEQLVNSLVEANNQFTTQKADLTTKVTLTGTEDADASSSDTVVSPNDNGDLNKMDEAVRAAREDALAAWLETRRTEAGVEIFDMPADVPYNVDMAVATAMPESSDTSDNTDSSSSPAMIQAALDAGLIITDDYVGTGAEAVDGSKVSVWYTGTLASDGSQFDSNLSTGTPFEFTLGAGGVIRGWDAGIVGMKVGGKRTLRIPASLGYGATGSGEKIPPNSDLVFTVELIEIL